METNFNKIEFIIKKATGEKKHPNLLAFITLRIEEGKSDEYIIISGFTLWKSKFGGYNVEVPNKPGFKYCLISKFLWEEITQKIIKEYNYESIPVIEENETL